MRKNRSWIVWITGLPSAGKTTIARELLYKLEISGIKAILLDYDEIRPIVTPQPTYSLDERDFFYNFLIKLAILINKYKINVVIAATGERQKYRDTAREQAHNFIEVWVNCPIEICRQRDVKGLYAKSDIGKITKLPGVGIPYENPDNPEIVIDATNQSPEKSAMRIINYLFNTTDECEEDNK